MPSQSVSVSRPAPVHRSRSPLPFPFIILHGRPRPPLLCFLALWIPLLLTACAEAPPGHHELTSALAAGRQAWAVFESVPGLCAQAPGGPAEDHLGDPPAGRCVPEASTGALASLSYDHDHSVSFRYLGADGSELAVRSERDGGVLEVEVMGRTIVAGRAYHLALGVLAVAQRGPGYEEREAALRAHLESDDERLDLDEVRYALREGGAESFYRTFFDTWQTPAGTFVLEDGVYEGHRTASGRWQLQAEGTVLRDGLPFASVEVGGPTEARRAVVALGREHPEL